jgi:hypothetical protein
MTAQRDPDRLIHAILMEGSEQLQDQIYDAVRAGIERKRQRAVIGPWRMPDMNKLVPIGLGAAAVVLALVIATQLFPRAPSGVGAAPSPTAPPSPAPIGGTVEFQLDGSPTTSIVDVVTAIADGSSVSGTAVTTFGSGAQHKVRLECAARDRDRWGFVGTTEQTTVPGEQAGEWSGVFVQDGSPQQIGILMGVAKEPGDDCAAKFGGWDMSTMGLSNPVESGGLVPPPDLAP